MSFDKIYMLYIYEIHYTYIYIYYIYDNIYIPYL